MLHHGSCRLSGHLLESYVLFISARTCVNRHASAFAEYTMFLKARIVAEVSVHLALLRYAHTASHALCESADELVTQNSGSYRYLCRILIKAHMVTLMVNTSEAELGSALIWMPMI